MAFIVKSSPSPLEKLGVLSQAAQFDVCAPCSAFKPPVRPTSLIYHSLLPNGKYISLLKVLLSNQCQSDCFYCASRACRKTARFTFKPEEMAKLFLDFYRKGRVEGLFLSSAILNSSNHTMEMMLKTVEILRLKAGFKGYVHLKVLPEVSYSYVERAVELSDRVSINLEAPNSKRLAEISSGKNWDNLLERLRWLKELKERRGRVSAGLTTQFVVGAAGETDSELLKTTSFLYRELDLSRVYFSAFRPVSNTPLEHLSPVSSLRERRLYQADFLMRLYGFKFKELVFGQDKKLPLEVDPKVAWAKRNGHLFPLDISKASYSQLLRVPGIGPISARRLASLRHDHRPKTEEELKKTGVVIKRARPFILLGGRQLESFSAPVQLSLV